MLLSLCSGHTHKKNIMMMHFWNQHILISPAKFLFYPSNTSEVKRSFCLVYLFISLSHILFHTPLKELKLMAIFILSLILRLHLRPLANHVKIVAFSWWQVSESEWTDTNHPYKKSTQMATQSSCLVRAHLWRKLHAWEDTGNKPWCPHRLGYTGEDIFLLDLTTHTKNRDTGGSIAEMLAF